MKPNAEPIADTQIHLNAFPAGTGSTRVSESLDSNR